MGRLTHSDTAVVNGSGDVRPEPSVEGASAEFDLDIDPEAGRRSGPWSYVQLLRPAQWVKNTFVFAALLFGQRLTDLHSVELSLAAFAVFCMASSAGYVFNDILDRERDRHHPRKRNRPIARGAVSVPAAWSVVGGLLVACVAVNLLLMPGAFALTVAAYLSLTIFYSLVLKHRLILDVTAIAVLFVLRAIGGAAAIQVDVSPWLLVCTFMLCLFLGFGKRRCEIAMISKTSGSLKEHRSTLVRYTPDLLNHMLTTSGGIAIITFVQYTLDSTVKSPFGPYKHNLIYTLPLVVYGIFRYAMLIELGKASGPTDMIAHDPPFLATLLLWVASAIVILYGGEYLWPQSPAAP